MVLVAEENVACDAPHVVYEIRIEEVHRPSLPFRRKAAEHKYPGPLRQKRLEGMLFCLYVLCTHGNKDSGFAGKSQEEGEQLWCMIVLLYVGICNHLNIIVI